jgi:hypothetical protein
MSIDEIRAWLTFLLPIWGTSLLTRTMAFKTVCAAKMKADGRQRIYPTEQVRCSHTLKRIISGELVPIRGQNRRGKGGKCVAGRAVIADHPVPLRRWPNLSVDLKSGRLKIEPPEILPKLPSFKSLLDNPPRSIWYGRDK